MSKKQNISSERYINAKMGKSEPERNRDGEDRYGLKR